MRLEGLSTALFLALCSLACGGSGREAVGDQADAAPSDTPDAGDARDAAAVDLGCKDQTACAPDVCNLDTGECVACVVDGDCAPGHVCSGFACVAGCTAEQACAGEESCCEGTCSDTQTDPLHCGQCGAACEVRPGAVSRCEAAACVYTCEEGFVDCNGAAADGCEHSAEALGNCACEPLSTRDCYDGAEGTQNVGACRGGTSTCDASGLFWGPCEGQVLPMPEQCANQVDDDCDGDVDHLPDVDGDGFTACEGDCCETEDQCPQPALVHPSAFDFPGDNVDDDCSGSAATAPAVCSSGPRLTGVAALDAAAALDLCEAATALRPGLVSASFVQPDGSPLTEAGIALLANTQSAVLTVYGTSKDSASQPQQGPTMLGLSTGSMRDTSHADYSGTPNTALAQSHDVKAGPIGSYLAAHGGSFPASTDDCIGSCPRGSGVADAAVLRLQLKVPTNANGFTFEYRFFSSEYWQYWCTSFNDLFLALLDSEAQGPHDKNIANTPTGPQSATSQLLYHCANTKTCSACPRGASALEGTGMEETGGATGWRTVSGSVVPGETITLHLMIFDVSDDRLDSHVLLDRFRWRPIPESGNSPALP